MYNEQVFTIGKQDVTLKSWLADTDYAEGFQMYYVTRKYLAWAGGRKVIAQQIYLMYKKSQLKSYLVDQLNNVMTISVSVRSQAGVRLYLPALDHKAQGEVLAYWREMGITARNVDRTADSPTPQADETKNINDWWHTAEYRRKLKKAENELIGYGHAASIVFTVGEQKYEFISDGKKTRVVKLNARQVQIRQEQINRPQTRRDVDK